MTKYIDTQSAGYEVAANYAQWHLGSRSWAWEILNAYLNPDESRAALEAEKTGDY